MFFFSLLFLALFPLSRQLTSFARHINIFGSLSVCVCVVNYDFHEFKEYIINSSEAKLYVLVWCAFTSFCRFLLFSIRFPSIWSHCLLCMAIFTPLQIDCYDLVFVFFFTFIETTIKRFSYFYHHPNHSILYYYFFFLLFAPVQRDKNKIATMW